MSNRCDQTYRERMGGAGTTAPVYAAAVAVCVGAVCTGIALAFTSNASEKLIAGQLNGLKMRQLDMYWNLCMMTMGACVSTLPVAMMLDSYGRKATMMVSTLPFYLGYILIVFAQHIYMVHVGRSTPYRQIFKDRGVVRATVIAVALQALKHLVGATLVLTFSSEIVRGCEFSNTMVKWSVIIGGLIQALASLIPLKYVDTIGRRFLLIIGFTITFTTSIILDNDQRILQESTRSTRIDNWHPTTYS
ncbi:unnamed protein product [Callosobruchus maculatus]|uniref:Major facilitator superfamily (MFS) profile domain-containing protein n=1 Tax=Callosobruchus maculatus TaxID=64391 RepID=A0A653CYN3_CALMS|nr:unnamed protein product [Callosobruchus maculatus]